MHTIRLVQLNKRAVLTSVDVVSRVNRDDLGRPTPCSDWALADLLAHMTAQHHGFAAAARGNGGDLDAWRVHPAGADPVAEYIAAADLVLTAFAEEGVPDRKFVLAELDPVAEFPASVAVGFHLIDYVVHGWDVARSIDLPYELDQDLVDVALGIALAVPDEAKTLAPRAPFRPGIAVSEDAAPLDRILSVLGRSPSWPR